MAKIEPNNRTPKPKFNIFWIYGLIALFIIGWGMLNNSGNPLEITWATFKNQVLATGDVKKVDVIKKYTGCVCYHSGNATRAEGGVYFALNY